MTTSGRCSNGRGDRTTATAVVAAVAALACAVAHVASYEYGPDLAGEYCAKSPRGCCAGRRDECSMPILGTTCYCDHFCNHTRSEDCCPDYWSFCLGIDYPTPAPEIRREYTLNSVVFFFFSSPEFSLSPLPSPHRESNPPTDST